MSKITSSTIQLKIQLRNVTKPPVWRRVLIPSDITFLELHYIIQAAFGWYNEHLFKFQQKHGFENPLSLYSFNAESRFKKMREIYKD